MSMFGLKKHEGDPEDRELPDHLKGAYTWYWLELIARTKMPAARKTIAVMFASFANADGSEVRPSVPKIAAMAGLHPTKVGPHLKALIALGMLTVKRPGGGRSNPTVYRLTRPADITTLPLVLDPDMNPIPAGAAFIPLAAETPTPTLENNGSSNADSPAAAVASIETPAPALGNPTAATPESPAVELRYRPVDNSGSAVNPSVLERKPQRFGTETPAAPLPDLTKTRPTDQPWSSQASTSLAAAITEPEPPALAELVGPPDVEPWRSPPAEPAPRIVRGSATLLPDPSAYAAAHAIVSDLHGSGEFYRAAARRELRAAGMPDPPVPAVIVLAAQLAEHADPETRPA